MKGFDVGSIHAGEHDGKASLPLLVLLRRAGGAPGSHCIEEHLGIHIKHFQYYSLVFKYVHYRNPAHSSLSIKTNIMTYYSTVIFKKLIMNIDY